MKLRLVIPLAAVLFFILIGRLPQEEVTHTPSQGLSQSTAQLAKPSSGLPPHVAQQAPLVSRTAFAKAVHEGHPIQIAIGEDQPRSYIFRLRRATAEGFAFSLGTGGLALEDGPQAFEGIGVKPNQAQEHASLVLIGDALAAVIREGNGRTVYVRQDPLSGALQARRESFARLDTQCQIDPILGLATMRSDDPLDSDSDLWKNAEVATIEVAALTGIDPASGDLDKYVNPIPRGTAYDASLKDALMLLVLDKEATGSSDEANLKSKASLYLATISNVAAVYENQLGIRLLVSEMIMIPDTDDFDDIPDGDPIDDFRDWVFENRRNSIFQWSMAAKYGNGLDGSTLGVAFVSEIRSNSAVSVSRSTAIWDVIAHEMGHNLGSNHSQGGIMNASSTNGNTRSFFTDVSPGETSAKDIYDHARRFLVGSAVMRHPEEIPFAQRDYRMTPKDEAVRMSLLDNDDESVANGAVNALALEEVSSVTPLAAGAVAIAGEEVVFTPSSDFEGTAWFSYTVRGSVGNSSKGWLHKGDVAIDVGQFDESTTITLAPGASYSFIPTSTSGLTQPAQALVSRSRDDRDLLIIRVNADASGLDTFLSGAKTFTLNYTTGTPVVTNDRYIYDAASGPLRFNPLLNDEGAGEFWVNPIKPTIGVGTPGHDSSGVELFPTTFRLVSASNLTPEKGSLSTSLRSFVVDGQRNNRLDSTLTFTPSSGASGVAQIEYTVEDAVGAQAIGLAEVILPFRVDRLVNTGDSVRFLVPNSGIADDEWMMPGFDDSSWTQGTTGIGYDDNTDFLSSVTSTVLGLQGVNTSVFMRLPFTTEAADQYDQLSLRLKIDDGFVAYLNGEEIARSSNAPTSAPLPWNASAIGSTLDAQALQFVTFDVSDRRDQLRDGDNILAIHGLNASLSSSDFLLLPEMDGVVTSSSVDVVSPSAAAIRLPVGTGVLLEGKATGAVAGGDVTWVQVAGPAGGANFESAQSLETAVTFAEPGDYRLRLTAVSGTQSSLTTIDIVVSESADLPSGVEVSLGEDRNVSGLVATLSGDIGSEEVDQISWLQVSGSFSAIFSSPDLLTTNVGFGTGGVYGVRLVVENDGIRTFDDVVVTAALTPGDGSLAALVQPVSQVDSDSALLNGAAFFDGDSAVATYYLGLTDAGEEVAAWERVLPLGSQTSGTIQGTAENLLFAASYAYRLRVQRGDDIAWSEVGRFTTAAGTRLSEMLVNEGDPARVFVPTDASVDATWLTATFDDGGWISGRSSVGFDLDGDYASLIQTDVEAQMFEQSTSVYIRVPFEMRGKEGVEALTFRMRYDDAFVAYLNGHEVVRSATAPRDGPLSWETAAAILREDEDAVQFKEIDLSHHAGLLVNGTNVLSIHGLNFIVENRDLLLSPQLEVTRGQTYYEQWLTNYPDLSDEDRGLLGNPDGDAFDNLQEYVFGSNPTQAESVAQLTPSVILGDRDQVELSFQRRFGLDILGVNLALESSLDLVSWTSESLSESSSTRAANGVETVTVALTVSDFAKFWRLRTSVD